MKSLKAATVLAVCTILVGLAGYQCSQEKKGGVQAGQPVTFSGSLQQGSLSALGVASYDGFIHPLDVPLVNYKLYCVTFEDVPTAATGTADNTGRFSLSIKALVPFGCFVLDPSNKHVADLLFAGLGETSGSYTGSIMLTDNANVGTITVDPTTGMAVVNVAGVSGVAGSDVGAPFDPTGGWTFTCTSPAGDPVYTCPSDVPPSLYLDRISGIFSSDNKRHYGLGVWASQANYTRCGGVEGISPITGSTIAQGPSGQTVTLDRPDGPLTFTFDSVWQPALDSQTQNTWGQCGAPVTLTCSQVTNVGNWQIPGTMTTMTTGQCQQECYANAFENFKRSTAYCMEERNYIWNQNPPSSAPTNDNNIPFIDFGDHKPSSRFLFGELIYSSNTSAAVAGTEYWVGTLWDQVGQQSYTCYINSLTKVAIAQVDANTLIGAVDQYRTLSGGSPTQCTSTAIPNNSVLQDINSPMHMMFRMTK